MQDTRETLLDLAEKEACERGFSAVSYGHLAELSGLRKASIHHHFPAKADLGMALLDRHADRLASHLDELGQRARTGGEALRNLLDDCRKALGEGDRVTLIAALSADAPQLPEAMRALLAKAQDMIAQWLGNIMQRGRKDRSISVSGEPFVEGIGALAQITGAQIAARAAHDPAVFDRSIATLTARMFRS